MKKLAKIGITLCMVIMVYTQNANAARLLIPGGQVLGLALEDNTVTVAAFDEETGQTAKAAGLQIGDRIAQVNEKKIASAEDVKKALMQSGGTVDITIFRENKEKKIRVSPAITNYGPRLGVFLKEGVTGIGTVTWYEPETGVYGALGHGVNTQKGGLLQLRRGQAFETSVASVKKGMAGKPGQLVGSLHAANPLGSIQKNTPQGVFGKMDKKPVGQSLPVADKEEIHTGAATIRSTVRDNTLGEYSVEILKIYPNSRDGGRNLLLKVTDENLLNITSGIVQGMSGSPIIQDGKLVGAVTHVLVNDPTTGYGIFIENMLDAAA